MESPREEEKRTTKKHVAARHGVGSGEDGVHLAGYIVTMAQRRIQLESFHRCE